jgi:dethiobiotin synthetase
VGKTVVTAALAGALRRRRINAGVMKPVATGCKWTGAGSPGTDAFSQASLFSPDTNFLRAATGVTEPDFMLTPVCLEPPLAPAVAARMTATTLSMRQIAIGLLELCERHDVVLVEGVGGFLVPLDDETLLSDVAQRMKMTVLVVARPTLGTINHTLLTVEAVWRRELRIAGVVFCETRSGQRDASTATNADEIARISGVRILGTLPYDPETSVEECRIGRIIDLAEENLDIEGFIRRECKGP